MKPNSITKIALLSVAMAALVALAARPSAAAITTDSTTPFNTTFINPCNGHLLISAGLDHIVASTTFDGAGFQTRFHLNEEQARDTDTVTGAVCTDTGNLNEHGLNYDVISGIAGGLPIVVGVNFTGLVSCAGSGGVIFSLLVHVTVNPNGIVTVDRNNSPGPGEVNVKCK
jgi:hypothetical protein